MPAKTVEVLRLGHRIYRDIRVTTHCCLTARALGAKNAIISGENDEKIEKSVQGVNKRFGLGTTVEWTNKPEKLVKEKKKQGYKIVHLTMYGIPVQREIGKVRHYNKVLVVVGAEKVPAQFYQLADHNIAITSQPHSEIAALAVFLDNYFQGKELEKKFKNPKRKIVPQKKGKKVKNLS